MASSAESQMANRVPEFCLRPHEAIAIPGRDKNSFPRGVQQAFGESLREDLQGNDHFASLRSSISRRRLRSVASMASSCRIFSISAS